MNGYAHTELRSKRIKIRRREFWQLMETVESIEC